MNSFGVSCAKTVKRIALLSGGVVASCEILSFTPSLETDPWVRKYLGFVDHCVNVLLNKLRSHPDWFLIFFFVMAIIDWLVSERTVKKHKDAFITQRKKASANKKEGKR